MHAQHSIHLTVTARRICNLRGWRQKDRVVVSHQNENFLGHLDAHDVAIATESWNKTQGHLGAGVVAIATQKMYTGVLARRQPNSMCS